jgi:dipeptidyl aminopeptidase/acylaminoacyl peptidase
VQYQFGFWLRDSSGFVYTGNQDSPSDFQIFRYDFSGPNAGKSTRLLAKEGSWEAADITPDGKRLLVAQFRSASDSSIFELDTTTGELTDLTVKPEGGTASTSWVGYAPDYTTAILTSDHLDGQRKLYRRRLDRPSTGNPPPVVQLVPPNAERILPDTADFELDEAGMNPEKTLLGVVTNQNGYGVPHLYHLPGLEPAALPRIPQGVVNLGQMRGQRVLYSLSNARTPGLAFAFEAPKKGDRLEDPAPRQITFADTQGIDLSRFALPELVEYSSFDGLKVPAFVYLPPNAQKGKPIPFVVRFHGGPEGQSRPAFEREAQYLLTRGYGLMLPNVRGSTGYGRDYLTMDDYTKRWDSVKDGVEAARWLVKQGYSRPGRIAVWGGSYGGFMAAATPVEDGRSDAPVLGASVDIVGIVNFRTFLEQTAGYRRKLREVEYGPLTDGAFLDSISPLKHIESIKIPMLIGHGLNDPRVPVGEALQLNLALRKRGIPTDLLVFPDEGHGFAKLENRLIFSKTMVEFLDRTIGK